MLTYKIDFFTFWHTGSGLSGGTEANLLVIKNQHHLPFIPGKTLKGLLRESAEILHSLNSQLVTMPFIETVFGLGDDNNSSIVNKAGVCFFGNAELSQYISEKIKEEQKSLLYTTIASTAIDEDGQAKNHSLRQIEVTIPLTLYANIEHFPEDEVLLEQIKRCFQWIKKLGSNRSRGLGRCEFSLYK